MIIWKYRRGALITHLEVDGIFSVSPEVSDRISAVAVARLND